MGCFIVLNVYPLACATICLQAEQKSKSEQLRHMYLIPMIDRRSHHNDILNIYTQEYNQESYLRRPMSHLLFKLVLYSLFPPQDLF